MIGTSLKIIKTDFVVLITLSAICCGSFTAGQTVGWIITIIAVSACLYFMKYFRFHSPLQLPSAFLLLLSATFMFFIALTFGLRHPPFMVPPGWTWPPFASTSERIAHAFALSLWTVFVVPPTLLVLGLVRRTFSSARTEPRTPSDLANGTNRQMHHDGNSREI